MQVIPGWDFVPICCCSDVNPGCHILVLQRDLFRWVKRAFLDIFCSNHPPCFPFSSGSFLPYRVTHFILPFNCTKHTSSKPQTLKKKNHRPRKRRGRQSWNKRCLCTRTHRRTHAHIWFQFQMPFLIYFPPSILTHTIVFLSVLNLATLDHSHRVQIGQWIATCHQHN